MKKFGGKNKGILISILLTVIIISIIFLFQGIYPFGNKIFGLADFDHAYIPVYYKLWDILHGKGTFLFDWNLGSGLNCFGSLVMNSLLLPSSLVIGLFPRDMIPSAMSFIVILKLIQISIFAYLAMDKLFDKVDYKFKIAFTLIYTFSGWTFFNFSNILYADVVALFPLFVLAYYRLMKEGKWLMYVIILTISLLLNYYMSWMILFFIIGVTIISLVILEIKEKKKKAVLVFLLTLGSLGLSCVLFLPSFVQSISSYRMSNQNMSSYYSTGILFLKIVNLFPLFIPIFLCIKQFLIKKDKKINIFFIILLIYLLVGILVEPINKLWHTGSYAGFPFRYSYIPSFIIISCSMYYLNNNYEHDNKKNLVNVISVLVLLSLFGGLSLVYYDEVSSIVISQEIEKYSQFFGLLMLFFVGVTSSLIIFKNNNKLASLFSILFIFVNTLFYGFCFMKSGEQTSLFTQQVKEEFELFKDNYNYMDYTYELNNNFPYILEVPSMENRLHIIKKETYDFYSNLGYNKMDSFMYSKGGTIFTNLLMNNKYIFSHNSLNEDLYKLIDKKDNLYYYESKYNLDYLVPYNGKVYNKDTGDFFENQNSVYRELFDYDKDILNIEKKAEKYKLKKDRIYYLYVECDDSYYCNHINDIDKVIIEQNTILGEGYNHYIEFYVNEDIDVSFDNDTLSNLRLAYIDIKEFKDFYERFSKESVEVNVEKNKKIFQYESLKDTEVLIPIIYDDAFLVKVNGNIIDYKMNIYNMLSIPLKKGYNKIEIIYRVKYLKEGIIISIVTFILFILVYFTNKRFHYLDKEFVLIPLFILSLLIGVLFILKVYILSIF